MPDRAKTSEKAVAWAEILTVLADVQARKSAWLELRRSIARKHAPDFNVFEFLRADEIGLSGVICWMLDPAASHGQGDTFLRAFCELLGVRHEFATDCVIAETEFATHAIAARQRRIDIHIGCGDFILAIENKPYADWQPRQVADYLDHLDQVAPGRHCLVLLKGERGAMPAEQLSEPRAAELAARGRLIDSDYNALERWVRSCERLCDAARVRTVLVEFADHLNEVFGRGDNMDEHRFLVDALRGEPARLTSALDLISAGDALMEEIRQDLVAEIANLTGARGWTVVDYLPGRDGSTQAWPIYLDFKQPLIFALVAGYAGADPYIGLRWRNPDGARPLAPAALDKLNEGLGASKGAERWWAWWRYLTPADLDGLDPTDFSGFWAAMNDKSKVAPRIVDWATTAYDILRGNIG